MSSKMKIVLALVVMLGLAGSAQAVNVIYFWGNTSGDWASPATWNGAGVPSPTPVDPNDDDIAIILHGTTVTVTTDGQGAIDMMHGYDFGTSTLNIAAGKHLQIAHVAQVGCGGDSDTSVATGILNAYGSFYGEQLIVPNSMQDTGIVNIYTGGSVAVGGWGLSVGFPGATGTGTINLEGGTMAVASPVTINPLGRINIHSGTLSLSYASSLTMLAGGRIDITGGTLTVQDDSEGSKMYYIQPNITNGRITGYGGAAPLTIDVNSTTYLVKITAPVAPTATNPSPADKQRHVALNTVLSWVSSSTSHDVYLGTDATAVANATTASPEYKGRQSANSYNPGGLAAGQAYYWRIDEFDGTIAWKGTVWSFATQRTAAISLTKGIALDRQFHTMPVESWNTIDTYDVALIKRMGFTFAKLLINPQVMISGSTINTANMAYVDEIVNRFLDQGVPVVVCIHPEPEFKNMYLGNNPAGSYTAMLGFYHDFAGYLAARWSQTEVVFQLMTEPFGNYTDWNTMLPQMVSSVRSAMPSNTLIIGGAQSGKIAGLTAISQACINAINDNNVYYGFTYWDEEGLLAFLFQGGGLGPYYPYLKNVPYPSSTSNVATDYVISAGNPDYSSAVTAVNTYCQKPWNMTKQESVLQPIADWNTARGGNLKVICYEMGVPIDPCQTTSGGVVPADRIQYIHDKRLALEERNFGWAYWSYNETFTVLNYPLRTAFEKGITSDRISGPTLVALGLPCGCGCITDVHPAGDINSDCYVNFKDFAALASSWLKCNEPTNASCVP